MLAGDHGHDLIRATAAPVLSTNNKKCFVPQLNAAFAVSCKPLCRASNLAQPYEASGMPYCQPSSMFCRYSPVLTGCKNKGIMITRGLAAEINCPTLEWSSKHLDSIFVTDTRLVPGVLLSLPLIGATAISCQIACTGRSSLRQGVMYSAGSSDIKE